MIMHPSPPYIKMLKVLHVALLTMQVLSVLAMFSLVYFNFTNSFELGNISNELLIASVFIFAIAYQGGETLFKRKLAAARESNLPAFKKMEVYRSAHLMRWAIMEFAAILCTIFFFLTGNYYIILIAALLIILFFTTKPGAEKTLADLQISAEDMEKWTAGNDSGNE